MDILQRCRGGGVSIFYTHKKEREIAQFPRHPGCPFRAIRPCCLKKLLAPLGWYPFLTETPRGGVPKFYAEAEGGTFFTDTFPEKYHPPPL